MGCGDDGSIDEAQFEPSSPTAETATVEVAEVVMVREADSWKSEKQLIRRGLAEAINLLAEDFIEETGIDWSDEDGGFGGAEHRRGGRDSVIGNLDAIHGFGDCV